MSYPSYPSTLPLPLRGDYGIDDKSSILRTDMADGLARQRRRFANPPGDIQVRWNLSAVQYAVWRGFIENIAKHDWFLLPIKYPGVELSAQCVRLQPGFKTKLFGKDTWIISGVLDLRAQPIISAELSELLGSWRFNDLLVASSTAHNYIELNYPLITIPV